MIDLHLHTTHSDGLRTPAEILQMAEKLGITLLSITDHSKASAYKELEDPAVRSLFSGKILRGIEIPTIYQGQLVDILGYGIDPEGIRPYRELQDIRSQNYLERELKLLYETYQKKGVRLDLPITAFSKEKFRNPRRFLFHMLQHPDNQKFFLDPANKDVFRLYYRREMANPKSPLFVDYSIFFGAPQEAVDFIHQAGGLAFLAHCYSYTSEIYDHLEEMIQTVPFDGIECWYPSFTPEQTEYLEQFCAKHHLLQSGGSDYHGEEIRPGFDLGTGNNGNLHPNAEKILPWAEKYLI